mgnify:CR=1 FL=1
MILLPLQHSFLDFNQPLGLHMNPDNRWIKLADRIPWDTFEVKYAELFPSDTGNVAKPLRMALGALIIQTKFQYSDRELVEQIAENPYLQYFIGLPGFRKEAPFDASTLVLFRKRISAEMLMEVNEYLLAHKDDDKDDHTPPSGGKTNDDGTAKEDTHKGTLTLDATCAPANIRYPQDISLLNEAREKLETMIYRFCKCYGLKLPRRYRKRARKEYLAFAKSRKHKVKAPVEFGAKFDLSLDSEGYGRIEKISFEAYNESTCLIEAIERFRERTGYYLERVLEDQIYRTRETRNYCKEHGIRLSGPKLGRPSATTKVDKKQEYQDNTDRIEVERTLSLIKRCYGMSCITTKLEETQLTSIALSVFVTNLFRIQRRILYALLHLFRFWHDWNRCKSWKLQIDT